MAYLVVVVASFIELSIHMAIPDDPKKPYDPIRLVFTSCRSFLAVLKVGLMANHKDGLLTKRLLAFDVDTCN